MQELDKWTEDNILSPLEDAAFDPDAELLPKRAARVKEVVRQKVLESYRNGQAAGPTKPRSFRPRH